VLGGGRASAAYGRTSGLGSGGSGVHGGRASTFGVGGAAGKRLSMLPGMGRLLTIASLPVDIEGAPFDCVICACAGMSSGNVGSAQQGGGLGSITCSSIMGKNVGLVEDDEEGTAKLVHVSSMHLIGMEDPLKTQSKALAGVSFVCRIWLCAVGEFFDVIFAVRHLPYPLLHSSL